MRKRTFTMIAMVVLLGGLALSARAQCSSGSSKANIPFQFNVAQTTLPAGEYTITCLRPESGLLLIRNKDQSAGAAVLVVSVNGKVQDHGKLMFRRYGSQYFFAQAWTGGTKIGLELPKSRTEIATERKLGIKPKSDEIAVSH